MPDLGKMGSGLMDKMGMGNAGLSDDDAKAMETRLKAGEMTFDDFLVQVKVMQKGASMQAMLGLFRGIDAPRPRSQRRLPTERVCRPLALAHAHHDV
jgi:signal recognition particle GTPase